MWISTLRCNCTSEEFRSFKKLTGIEEPCSMMLWRKMRMMKKNALNEDVHDVEVDAKKNVQYFYVLYDHAIRLFFTRKLPFIS